MVNVFKEQEGTVSAGSVVQGMTSMGAFRWVGNAECDGREI